MKITLLRPLVLCFLMISGSIFLWRCTGTKIISSPVERSFAYSLDYAPGWLWIIRSFPVDAKGREYMLRFGVDKSIRLSLDINNCYGSYSTGPENKLNIPEVLACTEACCDQPGALAFVEQLSKSNRYEIRNDTLVLYQEDDALYFKALTDFIENE